MKKSYEELLESFEQLWVNRSFDKSKDAFTIIQTAIFVDLNDELTHPRARSTPKEKFNLALKRILSSKIPIEDQQQIISLYESELSSFDKE